MTSYHMRALVAFVSISFCGAYAESDVDSFSATVATLQQNYPSITKQNVAQAISALTEIFSAYGSLSLPQTPQVQSALTALASLYNATWTGYAGWRQADREKLTVAYKDAGINSWTGDTRWQSLQQSALQEVIKNVKNIQTFISEMNSAISHGLAAFCRSRGYTEFAFIAEIEADDSTPANKKWLVQPIYDVLVTRANQANDQMAWNDVYATIDVVRSTNFMLKYTRALDDLKYSTQARASAYWVLQSILNKVSDYYYNGTSNGGSFGAALAALEKIIQLPPAEALAVNYIFVRAFIALPSNATTVDDCKRIIAVINNVKTHNYLDQPRLVPAMGVIEDKLIPFISAATTVADISAIVTLTLGAEIVANAQKLGTAIFNALTRAVNNVVPAQYQGLKKLIVDAQAKIPSTNFASILATITQKIDADYRQTMGPTVEKNLIANLGKKTLNEILSAVDAALAWLPLNQVNVGNAILGAFTTALSATKPLIKMPEDGAKIDQRFNAATNKKATYFNAAQQAQFDKLRASFTSRYNQLKLEKQLVTWNKSTTLEALCPSLAKAVSFTTPLYVNFIGELLSAFDRAVRLSDENLKQALSMKQKAKTAPELQKAKVLFDATKKLGTSLAQSLRNARSIRGINQSKLNQWLNQLSKSLELKF
ncbi:MAG: hypothetical protein WCW33_03315 [Candidatus Babeliales bacterium]